MYLELKSKRFLVIDDYLNFRKLMRRMLESLGATDIDDAHKGEAALRKMECKSYDIVLCDYNLGEGKKDGQQVLEEARHRSLIGHATVFIMLTAENTMPMVMGAVEYQPDDYLIKPVTKDILHRRIEKFTRRKEDLRDIERAIRKKEFNHALSLCDQGMKSKPVNAMEYIRLKGDLLMNIGKYDEAGALFEEVLEERDIPWARIGRGKVYFLAEEYLKAKETFQEIIGENRNFMEAYDWLAKTMEELGSVEEAQQILKAATEISPKAILRHQAVGSLSFRIKDFDSAEEAYRSAISIGKHSCFKRAADYTGLAKTYVSKDSARDALTVLSDARKEFREDNKALLETTVTKGIIYKSMDRTEDARKVMEEAKGLMSEITEAIPAETTMDMAKMCFQLGDKEQGMELMKQVVRNNHDDEKIIQLAHDVFEEVNLTKEGAQFINRTRNEIIDLNNEGVDLVKKGKLEKAIEYFEKAARGLPESKVINANAAQALIMYMQERGVIDEYLHRVEKYLDRVRKVDPRYRAYQKLMDIFEKLKTSAVLAGK